MKEVFVQSRLVKFCEHHQELGTTDFVDDFMQELADSFEETGLSPVAFSIPCGCSLVTLR